MTNHQRFVFVFFVRLQTIALLKSALTAGSELCVKLITCTAVILFHALLQEISMELCGAESPGPLVYLYLLLVQLWVSWVLQRNSLLDIR